MNRLQIIVLFFLLSAITSFQCIGQSNNFAGNWTGTANWGVQNFNVELELSQVETKLNGFIFFETLNKKKFAKYAVSGKVTNEVALVKGTEFIKKEGIWCLSGIELTENTNKLTGKWKANTTTKGCFVPGVGRINLTKTGAGKPIASKAFPVQAVVIADEDKTGNSLYTVLQNRRYYALIIGVQDYKDSNVIDLDQPIADATALKNELIAEYGFKNQDITFLKNPDRSTLIETFDHLTATVKNTDNLLIFYAGHGIWDAKIEQGYWLPSNAKKSSKAAWLSNGTIRDYIRAIDSKHTLLITDACFGGGILKTRAAFTSSKAMLEMYKLPSRKAMTSGSLKTVPDKSVFIEYLIKALKSNNQPLISADQLFGSFKYNVINNSPNGQVPQYGVISQADDEGGDFIFIKKN
ncbi:MAG: caspase family protein [Cyclobacteriaceae bacterium]|nr:caspase family protein [Cyclobacteriaceae bacterium]